MRPSRLDPERWKRVDEIFDAVLDAAPDERGRVVRDRCGDDTELRAEVEALVAASVRSDPPLDASAAILATDFTESHDLDEGARRVGPFRLLREVGRGGMGVVYMAEDTRLGRYVALKVLPPYLGVGRGAKRRFETEARAVSRLDHPNIATLHEIGESEDGQLYMVFAFYAGETLEARIAHGPVPTTGAVEVAMAIAAGLGAAHDQRIVHRDVKPSNVLICESGVVKLLDFSVAKIADEDLTAEGVRLGTASYMSPEQLTSAVVDHRTDLWSLGVVLYEMLTGARPFRAHTPSSTLQSILNEHPEPLTSVRSDLPDALELIVDKLLSKDPDDRYGTAKELLEDLTAAREGGLPPVATRRPPPGRRPRIRRVAVLPLTDLTEDPDRAHLVHGIHEAMIAELGTIHTLEVVRGPPVPVGGGVASVPEIARKLDVDAGLEGSVSTSGERLSVTVRLIQASPERQIWANAYPAELQDVFDIAGEVARSVAEAFEVSLTPSEQSRLTTRSTVEPEAYEAFTLGSFHLERRSPEGIAQAQKYLRRAIEIDPSFAPAYAALAEAYGSATFFGLTSPADGLPMVRPLIEKALELDDTLPEAHTSRGAVRYFGDWDWPGAEASLRRAIELNPSYAYAYFLLADVLAALGRYDEALAASRRNGELEQLVPFSAFSLVIILNFKGDFDEAAERARAGVEFFADFWQGHWLLARSYMGKGMYDDAVAACEAAADASRRTPLSLGALGRAYALAGDAEKTRAVLSELETVARSAYVPSSSFAMIHGALGELDEAFQWLEQAYEERDMALVHLPDDVLFDDLRTDRRLGDLLRRMGLERPTDSAG